MTPEQRQQLLSRYATGGLSDAEKRALFEAALADQDLFNELAEEDALREVLADSQTRKAVLKELGVTEPWYRRRWVWISVAAPAFGVLILSFALVRLHVQQKIETPQTVATARVQEPKPTEVLPAPAKVLKKPAAPVPAPVVKQEQEEVKEKAAQAVSDKDKGALLVEEPAQQIQPQTIVIPAQPSQQTFSQASAPPPPAPQQNLREQNVRDELHGAISAEAQSVSKLSMAKRAANAPAALTASRADSEGAWHSIASGSTVAEGVPVRLVLTPASLGRVTLVRVLPDGAIEQIREFSDRQPGSPLNVELGFLPPGTYRYRLLPQGAEVFFTVR